LAALSTFFLSFHNGLLFNFSTVIVCFLHLAVNVRASSRKKEFHPKPLTEPYPDEKPGQAVTVSRHTAPLNLPANIGSSPHLSGLTSKQVNLVSPFAPSPFTHCFYFFSKVFVRASPFRDFNTTTS
jgi:hypothetical protein